MSRSLDDGAIEIEFEVILVRPIASSMASAHCSWPVRSLLGRISSTRTTEAIAAPAKMPKITISGTFRSRNTPKPQSASPP